MKHQGRNGAAAERGLDRQHEEQVEGVIVAQGGSMGGSADETCDVGEETGSATSPEYARTATTT